MVMRVILCVGLVLLLRSVVRSQLLSQLVEVFQMDRVVRVALLCQHRHSFPQALAPPARLSALFPSILRHL